MHDLAWTRSYHLRLAMASLFDDPSARKSIEEIGSVRIRYSPEHRSAALFALAWIATQSSWSIRTLANPPAAGTFSLEDRHGTEITAVLECESGSESITELDLEGSGFSLTIRRESAARYLKATWSANGEPRCQMFPAGPSDDAGLVTEQLMRGGRNRLFFKVLPVYRKLLGG